jgi:hypothetical protein
MTHSMAYDLVRVLQTHCKGVPLAGKLHVCGTVQPCTHPGEPAHRSWGRRPTPNTAAGTAAWHARRLLPHPPVCV